MNKRPKKCELPVSATFFSSQRIHVGEAVAPKRLSINPESVAMHPQVSKLYQKATRLDQVIRVGVDRILPRNLTIRYVAALIAVAALSISGQLIIQTSLAKQTEDQRRLRLLERQIHDSENLRKALLSLQFSSKDSQIKLQMDLIESLASELEKNGESLKIQGIGADLNGNSGIVRVQNLNRALEKMNSGLAPLLEQIHSLNTVNTVNPTLNTKMDRPVANQALNLLSQESSYCAALTEISKFYDQSLENQILSFKRIELLLLCITLLVLVLEALYVFRPGVENLYDALRIRSDFLGRMGHEMRNPMNSILGMTHLLFETPLSDPQQKYLSILQKSSTGLLEILNNLLDFSSHESGAIKVEKIAFNLYTLLERAIDIAVYGAHAHGIELILDLDTDVPLQLIGDPLRLQQVLTNLLGNAVKFTQHGEVILRVKLQKKTTEAWVQFSVIDTGMGIDKNKIDKIFDAFVQGDSTVRRRFGGTGLGLSISQDLVSLLGGTLSVESQKNIGSRFFFTLPLAIAQDLTVSHQIQSLALPPFDAWIAEPNEAVANTLTDLIRQCGGNPSRVQSNAHLNSIFHEFSPNPLKKEILLVDYDFAKDSLGPLLSKLRRESIATDSWIFIIKTTTSSSEIEKLAEHGIRHLIFKPIQPLQILATIEQSLTGHQSRSVLPKLESTSEPSRQTVELLHDSRPLKILAVDDSKDNQFLVKAYLKSLPYKLTFADNGRIAVEKFKASRFDLVLMDLQMPEMDGYTATQLIREWETQEKMPPTPVVAVSAHDQESVSDRYKASHFSSYLVKPISPNQLRRAIMNFTQHLVATDLNKTNNPAAEQDQAMAELESQIAALAPQYLSHRRLEIGELKSYLGTSHFDKIQSLGHRLKGNAKSYGFEELGWIGKRLEEAAEKKDAEEIQTLISETETYLNQFSTPPLDLSSRMPNSSTFL